jgi:quinoprotein glucose dehydrogenase
LSDAIVQRDRLSTLSARANAECKALYDANGLEDAAPFNPPRPGGAWTIMPIGATGGIDWGGASIDLDHGTAIANVTNLPTMITVTQGGGVAGNGGLRSTSGNVRFMDKDGRSCNGGRQGELVSIELATGKIAWRVPLGTLEDDYGPQVRDFGATNIGPSLVTRGGLVFIGAATDGRFHAYDSRDGRLLWQTKMSASANAGPMTYMGKDGRQYVVIAAGGPGNARRPSERENFVYHQTLVAFALPRAGDPAIDIVAPYPPRAPGPGESLATDSSGNATIVKAPAR